MQKRRSNKVSILIVPEDDAEPYSFRLKTRVVKGLYVLAVILLFHIIGGAVFYWKYAKLSGENTELITKNTKLQEDNLRVIELAEQFTALENDYRKVKGLLGVKVDEEEQQRDSFTSNVESSASFDNIMPAVKTGVQADINVTEKSAQYLLAPQKSKIHNYIENMPTLLPVKGFLTQDYQKDTWFGPKAHSGIDIVAKKGTLIRAAGAGVIIFANWTYDLGNLIIIDHGAGVLSYYGHNQRILKPEGTFVKKGDPIALLGNSGKSSGPHLHFEIWKDGIPVDPKEFILAFNENITTK